MKSGILTAMSRNSLKMNPLEPQRRKRRLIVIINYICIFCVLLLLVLYIYYSNNEKKLRLKEGACPDSYS